MKLETARLLLSVPRLIDAPELFDFLGDVDAMRQTSRLETLRDCRRHIAGHERQRRKVGYGPWTVRTKADGEIVGFGGLYDDPFDPGWGIEVGYAFASRAWGNGYATELTNFCLALARQELGVYLVRAFAHPDNAASRRVLEKAGFREQRFILEMNRYLYEHRLQMPQISSAKVERDQCPSSATVPR
jgi:RimJ/RimL family protein N-acetyltransferase